MPPKRTRTKRGASGSEPPAKAAKPGGGDVKREHDRLIDRLIDQMVNKGKQEKERYDKSVDDAHCGLCKSKSETDLVLCNGNQGYCTFHRSGTIHAVHEKCLKPRKL
eukprot:gene11277-9816_t